MKQALFFHPDLQQQSTEVVIDESTSKHMIQVLRMEAGERFQLTNGRGDMFDMELTEANRKRAAAKVLHATQHPRFQPRITIAISPIKNSSRFEWFLEKATEIGVASIIPLLCTRTEKQQLKHERLHQILVSAMLQSHQPWLPELASITKFTDFIQQESGAIKYIAHCEDEPAEKNNLKGNNPGHSPVHILIGPEGDFTPAEIEQAMSAGYKPVSLGETRLRTETAGIVAAALLINQ